MTKEHIDKIKECASRLEYHPEELLMDKRLGELDMLVYEARQALFHKAMAPAKAINNVLNELFKDMGL